MKSVSRCLSSSHWRCDFGGDRRVIAKKSRTGSIGDDGYSADQAAQGKTPSRKNARSATAPSCRAGRPPLAGSQFFCAIVETAERLCRRCNPDALERTGNALNATNPCSVAYILQKTASRRRIANRGPLRYHAQFIPDLRRCIRSVAAAATASAGSHGRQTTVRRRSLAARTRECRADAETG